jgi:hypothetical protein
MDFDPGSPGPFLEQRSRVTDQMDPVPATAQASEQREQLILSTPPHALCIDE